MNERARRSNGRSKNVLQTAAVVLFRDGHVLAVRNGAGTTLGEGVRSLPGGRANNGESDLETAQREFEEETGLRAKRLVEYPGNYFFVDKMRINGGVVPASFRVFLCTDYEGEVRPEPSGETVPEWIPLKDFHFLHHTGPNQGAAVFNAQRHLEERTND
ncbi:MAG: NUDIX hydrolase [Patescibacteria group bacterium]